MDSGRRRLKGLYLQFQVTLHANTAIGNVRFTKVPLKALSAQVWIRYQCFWKTDYFQLWVLYKNDLRISTAGKHTVVIRTKHF